PGTRPCKAIGGSLIAQLPQGLLPRRRTADMIAVGKLIAYYAGHRSMDIRCIQLSNGKYADIDVAIASLGEVGKARNGRANIFDCSPIIPPLHKDFGADITPVDVEAPQ